MHNFRIHRDASLLLVVDFQRKLAPAIEDADRALARTLALIGAAELFGIPKLALEHCGDRIGALVEPLRARFAADEIVPKAAFAATDQPGFVERIRALGRSQIVVAGMEAHVCVMQTALGLRAERFDVAIVADACVSRLVMQRDRDLAFARLAQAGCIVAGTETVLFEWTRDGTDERFRSILALVKSL